MKSIRNLALLVVLLLGLAAIAQVEPGDLILPHAVSPDGAVVVSTKITATDYARVLLAYTYYAEEVAGGSAEATRTLVDLFKTADKLFVADDGAVDPSVYELKDGKYEPAAGPTVAAQALMSYQAAYAHHEAMEGDLNMGVYAEIIHAPRLAIAVTEYGLDTFSAEITKLSDLAWVLLALENFRWLLDQHGEGRLPEGYKAADLEQLALRLDDLLQKVWSEELGIYADTFNADGSGANFADPKYDMGVMGMLFWGHAVLAQLLQDHPDRVAALESRACKFLNTLLVEGVTYDPNVGIVREIQVVDGQAQVANDQVNGQRLFDLVFGLGMMLKLGLPCMRAEEVIPEMLVVGAERMHDEYAIVHDYKFGDPTEVNDIKETPYLGAYLYAALRGLDLVPQEKKAVVLEAVEKDYTFLRDVITRVAE